MEILQQGQYVVYLALGLAALVTQGWAFVDCLRRSPQAFVATNNQTKVLWLVITGVSTAVGFVFFGGRQALGFLNLIAFVAAMVYLVRVKPAVEGISGGGGKSRW